MARIALIAINARYTHLNLAIRYLRNVALAENYNSSILEFTINQDWKEIISRIWAEKAEILAFSVYIWNTELVRKTIPEIRKILPESRIILGGPEVSYNPQNWLDRFPQVDFIITNAGESGFRKLLHSKFQNNDKIISENNIPLTQVGFPYLKNEISDLQHKYIYYESSRGCPFKCSYCLSSRFDQKLQFKKLEMVKYELSMILESKPKIVKFVDRTFNSDHSHSRKIWEFLIDQGTETRFHFEIHPFFLEDEDFNILSKVRNNFQFEIGVQSVNPTALKSADRFDNWQRSKKNIQRLKTLNNIHLHLDQIVGLPFDTYEDTVFSFDEIYELQPDHFQMGFLKILPGTKMAENAGEFAIKFTNFPPYQILQSKWLSFQEINEFRNIEKVLNQFYNSRKFKLTLANLVSKFRSPFRFYREFSKYLPRNLHSNWQTKAGMIIRFVEKYFPLEIEFMTDCLSWDWCRIAKAHFFPDFLDSEANKEARKICYDRLRSYSQDGKVEFRNSVFPVSALKKTIFFRPSSAEFRKLYLTGHKYAAFVQTDLEKLIIVLE